VAFQSGRRDERVRQSNWRKEDTSNTTDVGKGEEGRKLTIIRPRVRVVANSEVMVAERG
jgi:hypothetical protein